MTTTLLLNWMLLSTLGLGACWLFYYLVLRPERSFQFNRGLLLLAPLLTAALPLLPLPLSWLPPQGLTQLPGALRPTAWLPEVQVGASAAASSLPPWPLLLYAAGVVLSLLWQARRLLLLWHQTRHLPRQAAPGYTLRLTGGQLPISSFGRTVYWDETTPLSPAEAAQVLRHELVHVRQGHSADRLWLGFWQALLWFNPFVYLLARALGLTHEYLADAGAAPAATPAPGYAALLARQSLHQLGLAPTLAHPFFTSQTLTRITMLNRQTPVRRWKQWLVLPLLGLLVGAVACEKAAPLPPPPPPPPAPAEATVAPPPPPPPVEAATPPVPPVKVYTYVEHMPEYAGGIPQLLSDLGNSVKYPAGAVSAKLEGKVFVSFVVGEDGQLRDFKINKGIVATDKSQQPLADVMNQEALRAVRELPGRWQPGTQDGKPVSVAYTVPITFALKQPGTSFRPNGATTPLGPQPPGTLSAMAKLLNYRPRC
jgi:TonB family protein